MENSQLKQRFESAGRPQYIAYLMAGDGGVARTLSAMKALVAGGVDILEVGVPFSDPIADGPVIQAAANRALSESVGLDEILSLIETFKRDHDNPVILFSYYNPIMAVAAQGDFFRRAKQAGVDGCLIVDLPLELSAEYQKQCAEVGIDPVWLIAPSTPKARLQTLSDAASGMLYYVCRKGTTGAKQAFPTGWVDQLNAINAVSRCPVVVGFGIATKEMAKAVIEHADGFVIGSIFVEHIGRGASPSELTALAKALDPRSAEA